MFKLGEPEICAQAKAKVISKPEAKTAESRARLSGGASNLAIYDAVAEALSEIPSKGGTLVDVGCGSGGLWAVLGPNFARYVGLDIVEYAGVPASGGLGVGDLD